MKKIILSIQLNAKDNFEVGKCETCPISLKEYVEFQRCVGEYKYSCPIGYKPITCPMEVNQNG